MFLKFSPAFCVICCFVHCVRQRIDLPGCGGKRRCWEEEGHIGTLLIVLAFRKAGVVGKHQVGSVALFETRNFALLPPLQPQLCENLSLAQVQNQKMGLDHYDQTMQMTGKATRVPLPLTCQSPGFMLGISQNVQLFST